MFVTVGDRRVAKQTGVSTLLLREICFPKAMFPTLGLAGGAAWERLPQVSPQICLDSHRKA